MNKRVLMACYEVPGYGGGNTVRYRQFRRMQREGLDVVCVNLVHEKEWDYFRFVYGEKMGNPDGLPNVHNCRVSADLFGPQPGLARLIEDIDPDVLMGTGYIAARQVKEAAPERTMLFMTTGSQQMKWAIIEGVYGDYLEFEAMAERTRDELRLPAGGAEKAAVRLADVVVIHSPHVRRLLEYYYPSQTGKFYSKDLSVARYIYDEAASSGTATLPFAERPIDAIFLASDWTRKEKNYDWVRRIIRGCGDLAVHVVGDVKRAERGAVYHGLLTRQSEVLALLGQAKCCVCPSRFDAAPGILFEASAMGCNVVASRNCGNWELCHAELLADPYTVDGFVTAIRRGVARPYPDHREVFLERDVYEELKSLLEVL